MRHSIRTRITFIFIGLTVLILLAVWAANTWLLEDYYVQDKIKILEKGILPLTLFSRNIPYRNWNHTRREATLTNSLRCSRIWATGTIPLSCWWTM